MFKLTWIFLIFAVLGLSVYEEVEAGVPRDITLQVQKWLKVFVNSSKVLSVIDPLTMTDAGFEDGNFTHVTIRNLKNVGTSLTGRCTQQTWKNMKNLIIVHLNFPSVTVTTKSKKGKEVTFTMDSVEFSIFMTIWGGNVDVVEAYLLSYSKINTPSNDQLIPAVLRAYVASGRPVPSSIVRYVVNTMGVLDIGEFAEFL